MTFSSLIKNSINEARRIDLNTPAKGGTTSGDFLRALYAKFGDKAYSARESGDVRGNFADDAGAHRYRLLQDGYLEKDGSKFKISQQGLDWIAKNPGQGRAAAALASTAATAAAAAASSSGASSKGSDDVPDDEEDSDELARGVRDIAQLREKKFIVPKVSTNSKYLDQMKTILSHMRSFADGTVKTTYMLAGDPGTGKTSFIKSLSTLTGIPLVVIEAPHITQEHLINIPFLVIDGPKTRQGNLVVDDSAAQMKVVQSESNLVTQLKDKRKRTPEQIQREIDKNRVLKEIQPMIAKRIDKVVNSYNSILFLDEFYRTSSMKIRNVLRNILNGKIGNDRIPQGVYIIMATNVNDDGVEDIPLNQDFHLIDYDVSSKEDFMAYMYGKYVNNPEDQTQNQTQEPGEEGTEQGTASGISIKPEVWNKFMNELTDKELGFNDEGADVRLSPRRLEQMLISIDAMLPVSSEREAKLLLAFVKNNLSNYIEEKASEPLLAKFNGIVLDLINETKPEGVNIDVVKLIDQPVKKSEWREQLQTEIELKIKLGDNRKYIPVVSGQPGIGKTTQMVQIAQNLAMGFIQVDVSNLTPEDITGMPIADMSQGENNITTRFSDPNLYITIMKEYNAMIDDVRRDGRKYNVVLLFDEMNRASVPVFNAIRKVLLEKEFEHVKLPDDIIVTGAINPTDIGAIEFTSHTRDVLDIIPSGGNFTQTFEYIKNKEDLAAISERVGFELHSAVGNIMGQLALEFKSVKDSDDNPIEDPDIQPFWWNDGSSVFYVSPREMTECVANTITQIEDSFDDMGWDIGGTYSDEDYEAYIDEAINVTAKSFVNTFNMITLKQDIQGFTKLLGMKILGNEKFRKMFESIRTKKAANQLNLVQILKNANGDVSFLDKGVIGEYIKDFSSTEMIQDVSNITDEYFQNTNGMEALENTLALFDRLAKSLERLNVSNNYTDQLKKYIGGKVASLIKSPKIDILDIADDNQMVSRIEKLTPVTD